MVAQLNNLRSLVYQGIVSHVTNCTLEYRIISQFHLDNEILCILFIPSNYKVKTRVPMKVLKLTVQFALLHRFNAVSE